MVEHNLGSGQYLDESLDFDVDTTGDIRSINGIEEVEKDLSVQMIIELSQYLGEPPTDQTNAQIANTAYEVALSDLRVADVIKNDISVEWISEFKEMEVSVPVVIGADEQYDLVFNI